MDWSNVFSPHSMIQVLITTKSRSTSSVIVKTLDFLLLISNISFDMWCCLYANKTLSAECFLNNCYTCSVVQCFFWMDWQPTAHLSQLISWNNAVTSIHIKDNPFKMQTISYPSSLLVKLKTFHLYSDTQYWSIHSRSNFPN